jgi:hypothetical protein
MENTSNNTSLDTGEKTLAKNETAISFRKKDEHRFDADDAENKYTIRSESMLTNEMFDVLYIFLMLITCLVFLLCIVFNFAIMPLLSGYEKMKPETVISSSLNFVLFINICLLLIVRKKPEGKVIIFTLAVLLDGIIIGFTLANILRLLLYGLPSID